MSDWIYKKLRFSKWRIFGKFSDFCRWRHCCHKIFPTNFKFCVSRDYLVWIAAVNCKNGSRKNQSNTKNKVDFFNFRLACALWQQWRHKFHFGKILKCSGNLWKTLITTTLNPYISLNIHDTTIKLRQSIHKMTLFRMIKTWFLVACDL